LSIPPVAPANSIPGGAVLVLRDPDNIADKSSEPEDAVRDDRPR